MYWMADITAIIVEGVIPQCSILQQLADVGAKWQLELPPQGVFVNTGRCYLPGDRWIITAIGWCYCQVADGIGTESDYFSLSSGVLSRTSFHMCGRWYLPIVLLRDGVLTLLTLIDLFYPSVEVLVFPPHYVEIFYGEMVTSGVKMVIYRGGCLEVFFEPVSKCSWGLSNVFLTAFHPVTLVSIDDSTFSGWYLGLLEAPGGSWWYCLL